MNLKEATIQSLIQQDLKAKKKFGQNFLISEKALNKIINATDITVTDFILEIGPGTGNLTKLLFQKTKNLLCLEKDTDFSEILKPYPVKYIDALEFNPAKEITQNYKIIANIPYYITSPIINHYLKDQFTSKNGNPPKIMVLLIQKEVAEKICDPKFNSYLSIGIKTFGNPSLVGLVKKGCFLPIPKVDSAILKIEVRQKPVVNCNLDLYFQVCSAAFSNPRKKLSNNLKPFLKLLKIEFSNFTESSTIDLNLRAEKLNPIDFEAITNTISTLLT